MAKSTGLRDFIGRLIAATPEADLQALAVDTAIAKAMEVGPEHTVSENSRIWDQGQGSLDGTRVPGREEIPLGPVQESSGAGAEKMIRDYSNPAPQQEVVEKFNELSRELGQMRGYLKSFVEEVREGFKAIIKAEEKGDEEEDERKEAKSMADEIEDDDEDDEHEKRDSHKSLAASKLFDAAVELNDRATAARKAGNATKARSLKAKVEVTLEKAISLISKGGKDALAREVLADIVAFASVKGFDRILRKAEEEEEDEEDKDERRDEREKAERRDEKEKDERRDEKSHNQDKWAGKSHDELVEEVLKGNAILNGNMLSIMEAMQGRKNEMPVTPLGLLSKGTAENGDVKVLFKSNMAKWADVKRAQIEHSVDTGEFSLNDEMAADSILQTATAVQAGILPVEQLVGRVQTSDLKVRSLFEEVLEA